MYVAGGVGVDKGGGAAAVSFWLHVLGSPCCQCCALPSVMYVSFAGTLLCTWTFLLKVRLCMSSHPDSLPAQQAHQGRPHAEDDFALL